MWYGNSFNTSRSPSSTGIGTSRAKPTYLDILEATNAAVRVFEARGTRICAIGGLACKLFGNPRVPNDTDLLLLDTASSQEQLKKILVGSNSSFYLVPSRDPLATYKVLWYTTALGTRVKVDLLQPGLMSIPDIPPEFIEYKTDQNYRIPVAPFGLVLLLKLQAWAQHRVSTEDRYYEKHYNDVRDINTLLPLATASRIVFDYLPEDFRKEARKRVRSYILAHPDSKSYWKKMVLKTVETTPTIPPRGDVSRNRSQPVTATGETDLIGSFRRMQVADPYRSYGEGE